MAHGSARSPRFQIVKVAGADGRRRHYFARLLAANGRKVWQTEAYATKANARRAVDLINGELELRVEEVEERALMTFIEILDDEVMFRLDDVVRLEALTDAERHEGRQCRVTFRSGGYLLLTMPYAEVKELMVKAAEWAAER